MKLNIGRRVIGYSKIFLAAMILLGSHTGQSHAQSQTDQLRKGIEEFFGQTKKQIDPTIERMVPDNQRDLHFSYAPLVKKAGPAVVNVYAARNVVERSPFDGDPFFEQFFGRDRFSNRRKKTQKSLGSGVIVERDGVVITNHHVIKNADQVSVVLSDGREFEAKILLKDEKADLAVLKIQSDEPFPTLKLGDSDDLEVGDIVLAIGNPFGVGQTVTSGIVSALARSQVGVSDFGFFIQTDASINPGNSGGALIDMQGRLIGINTAIFSRSGGSNGIGFAIPSNMVKVVLKSVDSGSKRVKRPWIGATFQSVSADIAESLGMRRPQGAMVVSLVRNGPAQKAGIRVGDVILAVNDRKVDHPDALGYRLATVGIGNRAKLTILSNGRKRVRDIRLAEAPETVSRDELVIKGRNPFSGIKVANLSPAVAEELGIDGNKRGVIIEGVHRRSFAFRYGLRPKDIIRSINNRKILKTQELRRIVGSGEPVWEFVIERKGRLLRQRIR